MMQEVIFYFALFAVSLAVLLKASDWFVDAAEEIGLSLGISPFIIGVTIVAFGTSLPELATGIASVLKGESEIVVSTVVGSNITNIALVLGLVAVVVKQIDLEYNIWHIDMPYLWGSAFLFWFMLKDGTYSLFEALLSILGIIVFLAYSFKSDNNSEEVIRSKANWKSYAFLLLGGVLVYLGADYTIYAITQLSELANIETEIISLSAVALGTSLPEVIVSLAAARKGKASIAVGNVLGSNIFNTYVVMGIPALVGKLTIPLEVADIYLPLMIAMTLLFGIMANNKKITRWEGIVLLMFYAFFVNQLFS
ncbi:MAG: calcium/sodium antiporter [Bacteroidota bacterium]